MLLLELVTPLSGPLPLISPEGPPESSPCTYVQLLGGYLDEYNLEHKAPLELVFFLDAVKHIVRIARVLRQPRGSALLVSE